MDLWKISQYASGSAREDGVKMAGFPVWVGGLSLDVSEHVLHNFFHKFGPVKNIVILKDSSGKSKQCGFVNFWSQEAAETAAMKMEGHEVLGQVIKTKGPRELLATAKSTIFVPITTANSDKRDFKALTDCVFYTEKRECFPKTGEVSEKYFQWQGRRDAQERIISLLLHMSSILIKLYFYIADAFFLTFTCRANNFECLDH